MEAEGSYKHAKLDAIGFQLQGTPLGATDDTGGSTRTISAMLNGYFDLGHGWFRPYIGGGVGAARVQAHNIAISGGQLFDEKDWSFAWQAMGGVRAFVTPKLALDLRYRYFRAEKVRYAAFTDTLSTKLSAHSVLAGLTYSLGNDTPPPPRPGPPPPPPPPEPAPVAEPEAPEAFVVFFDWNKSVVTTEAASILDNAAAAFTQTGRASVQLAGHADTSGSASYNMALSERRAAATKAYLVGKGVPEAAIDTMAYGETRPLVATDDNVREPQNRRVEISFGPGSGQ